MQTPRHPVIPPPKGFRLARNAGELRTARNVYQMYPHADMSKQSWGLLKEVEGGVLRLSLPDANGRRPDAGRRVSIRDWWVEIFTSYAEPQFAVPDEGFDWSMTFETHYFLALCGSLVEFTYPEETDYRTSRSTPWDLWACVIGPDGPFAWPKEERRDG